MDSEKNHRKLRLAHDQLEEAHQLTKHQNEQIKQQADHLNQANHELTQANQFRDKIFSVISHDLRAPFSSLHSSIQLWDKNMLSEEELQEVMPLIARETNSLSLMLNNLLIWAKSQLGADEIQLSSFGVGELVQDISELFMPQASQKNLEFTHGKESGLQVNSDRERLGFILRNS